MSTGFAGTSYEPTWTTKQAAEFLGIAEQTLSNQISKGEFPRPRKQGRLNAFIPSEVAEIRRQRLGLPHVTEMPGAGTPGNDNQIGRSNV